MKNVAKNLQDRLNRHLAQDPIQQPTYSVWLDCYLFFEEIPMKPLDDYLNKRLNEEHN